MCIRDRIITVYDPSIHKQAEDPKTSTIHDERWVLCHRPAVLVGGELTVEMLDMQHNPASNYYVAPMQMKANNGVLVIDDFGRQRIRPEELLNRWIVPLDLSLIHIYHRLCILLGTLKPRGFADVSTDALHSFLRCV